MSEPHPIQTEQSMLKRAIRKFLIEVAISAGVVVVIMALIIAGTTIYHLVLP